MSSFIDVLKLWPEEEVLKYLEAIKTRCDEDENFEKNFFENFFEELAGSDVIPFQKLMDIFDVEVEGESAPDGDILGLLSYINSVFEESANREGVEGITGTIGDHGVCKSDDDSECEKECVENKGVNYTETAPDEVLVQVEYPVKDKLSIVGNTAEDLEIAISSTERVMQLSCTKKDPFIDKYVTHIVYFPEEYDLDSVQVYTYEGIAYIKADIRILSEVWQIEAEPLN